MERLEKTLINGFLFLGGVLCLGFGILDGTDLLFLIGCLLTVYAFFALTGSRIVSFFRRLDEFEPKDDNDQNS